MTIRQNLVNALNRTENEAVLVYGSEYSVGNEGVEFIQDSNFMYLSGVLFPGAALIVPLSPTSSNVTLYLPKKSAAGIAFDGPYPKDEEFYVKHGIAKVKSKTKLESHLAKYSLIHVLPGVNSTYGVPNTSNYLYQALATVRRKKTKKEIEIIEYASKVAASTHLEVFKRASSSSSEYSLLSLFVHLSNLCGSRVQAYSPIAASKSHAAILHYQGIEEDKGLKPIGKGLVLIDAAGSFKGYASDVTRTFPIGKWPQYGSEIYKLVVAANEAGIKASVAGVPWIDVSRKVDEILLTGLKDLGLVFGDLDALKKANVVRVFMPHGLGHTVGIDVHDVAPFNWVLDSGDILTIEPGIYFNKEIFDIAKRDARQKDLINFELINDLVDADFGGVRIEDVVLILEKGNKVLSSDAPKSFDEIESIRRGKPLLATGSFARRA